MSIQRFKDSLVELLPRWWTRLNGLPIVRGLSAELDVIADDTSDSIKARMPKADSDPAALALIGKERRILRGPGETAGTYASRLIPWLDDHRLRGGPYALARQLHLYWRNALSVPIDIVYWSGRRYQIDPDTGVVTRDDYDWTDPNGESAWAEFWIFFHVDAAIESWVDDTDDPIVDETDDGIIFELSEGTLDLSKAESIASVPREWNAAHVRKIHIVLLYPSTRLWGYPVKQWGSDWGQWQTSDTGRVEIDNGS